MTNNYFSAGELFWEPVELVFIFLLALWIMYVRASTFGMTLKNPPILQLQNGLRLEIGLYNKSIDLENKWKFWPYSSIVVQTTDMSLCKNFLLV